MLGASLRCRRSIDGRTEIGTRAPNRRGRRVSRCRPCTSADWPRPKTPTTLNRSSKIFSVVRRNASAVTKNCCPSLTTATVGFCASNGRKSANCSGKTAVFRPVMVEGHAHRAQLQRQRLHGSCGGDGCSPRCGRAEHAKSGIAIHDESLAHSRIFERPAMIFVMHSIRTPNFSRPFMRDACDRGGSRLHLQRRTVAGDRSSAHSQATAADVPFSVLDGAARVRVASKAPGMLSSKARGRIFPSTTKKPPEDDNLARAICGAIEQGGQFADVGLVRPRGIDFHVAGHGADRLIRKADHRDWRHLRRQQRHKDPTTLSAWYRDLQPAHSVW